MQEHTAHENAEVALQALWRHTESVWRAFLKALVASEQGAELDLDALTIEAYGTLPEPWRSMVSKETAEETIRDHLEWLLDQAQGSETG